MTKKNEKQETKGKKEASPAGSEQPKAKALPKHGIPFPSGSKFFGAPNQGGKRPGPRVPPAHPVHLPTGNRRGG